MGQVIAVVNQKGGVGKTTTAVNLGAALSLFSKSVLLVDIDPQANATSALGVDHRTLQKGIYEVILGQVPVAEVIVATAHQNFHLLPATVALAGANVELVYVDSREFKLSSGLSQVRNNYDFILIDCPPSLGLLTVNGLTAADQVLIPVQAEYFALEGLGQLLNTISLVQNNLRPQLAILGAVITMFDNRNRLSGQVMEELYKYFPHRVFRSVVPRSIRLTESPSYGKSIFHYDPDSKGAKAYERLAREILGEN